MRWSCFVIALILLLPQLQTSTAAPSPPSQDDVSYISFRENHLFFLSKSGNHFGFISRENGQIMTKYQLQEHETIISVQKTSDIVVLRNARTKVILFDIASSHIEEINVQIAFKHQQIIDVLRINSKYIVLTDKDVRMYDKGQQRKGESLKNIVTSGRKNEYFKKIFLNEGQSIEEMLIVLIKNGEVCIRTFKKVKRGADECFFKIPYEITNIGRINNSILIETGTVNYVISQNPSTTYSFQGKVGQISGKLIQLTDFKTYDPQSQNFIDGLIVEGSTQGHVFWIHSSEANKISIFYNSILVKQMEVTILPRRAWVSICKDKNGYDLLVEFNDDRLEMYEIQLMNDAPSKFTLKWVKKSLQSTYKTSEL